MFNKGDLVYVPSQVTLLQYDSLRVPKRLEKTSKPGHAIIAENDDAMNGQYKILNGGVRILPKRSVHKSRACCLFARRHTGTPMAQARSFAQGYKQESTLYAHLHESRAIRTGCYCGRKPRKH